MRLATSLAIGQVPLGARTFMSGASMLDIQPSVERLPVDWGSSEAAARPANASRGA
jgi:hypothetical protein